MQVKDIYPFDFILNDDNSTFISMLADNETYPLVNNFFKYPNDYEMTLDYFGNHSADKFLSPLAEKLVAKLSENTFDRDEFSEYIANLLYNRFSDKWKKIYDALMTEYNPLENYSMEEERTPDLTTEETQTDKSKVVTDRETSATNSYKGFNASEPVLVNKTDGEENVTTSGTKLDNETTSTTTQTGSETLTRSGNIGVTTSQQMLESEFKVRQYDFYQMIYNDIDSVLCLSVY